MKLLQYLSRIGEIIEEESGLSKNEFMRCFEELCDAGIIFSGFPSLLVALADRFPLIPMYGANWINKAFAVDMEGALGRSIFKRDDYTCQYCGRVVCALNVTTFSQYQKADITERKTLLLHVLTVTDPSVTRQLKNGRVNPNGWRLDKDARQFVG